MLPIDFELEKISNIFSVQLRRLPIDIKGGVKNEFNERKQQRY